MFARRACFFAVVIAALVFIAGCAFAQLADTVKDVVDPIASTGKVDWTTGMITAVGKGTPPAQPANTATARAMADRTAQVAAYRNLLETVKGVRVDSTTTIENIITTSDMIRTQVNSIIQGAMVMDKKYMPDGSVEVTVGMKLTGALSDALLPKAPPTLATGSTGTLAPGTPGQLYTGLIVDARGLGVRPAMSPKILNADGKEVYGSAWTNRDYAVREGMAVYMKDPAAAQTSPRVADKPLLVKALKVSGEERVDAVISNDDAAMLQSSPQSLSILEKCRVILLVDQ